jgi:hypothetical protein
MTDLESHTAHTVPQWFGAFDRALAGLGLAACLALLAYKAWLVDRININWDEFLYLSQVHALAHGELTQVFQTAYAHAFQWLVRVAGGEVEQLIAARFVMVALLGVTAALVWRLGRSRLEGFAVAVPPLAYLSAVPVLQHGGSFRADSLIAPLVVASLLLALRPRGDRWSLWAAGGLLGIALAVTLKAALMLPMILAVLLVEPERDAGTGRRRLLVAVTDAARYLAACGAVAAILLAWHDWSLPAAAPETVAGYGGRVARKVLFDAPWFAQAGFLEWFFYAQPLAWILMALGALLALGQRQFRIAALGFALLPVAFYRNAFPYFYVVMLAPAAPLAGFAVHTLQRLLRPRAGANATLVLVILVAIGLLYQGTGAARRAGDDELSPQRALVAAVHRIFPERVAYVDRCGMIASYRRAGFFMSSWGMEQHRARGVPFMPRALREHRPAFVLVNSPYLDPEFNGLLALLPEDREAIRDFYPVFWGPVRVAGAEGHFDAAGTVRLRLPFAATYRLASAVPVTIGGARYANGDRIGVGAAGLDLTLTATGDRAEGLRVALFHADAREIPDVAPPAEPIFSSL